MTQSKARTLEEMGDFRGPSSDTQRNLRNREDARCSTQKRSQRCRVLGAFKGKIRIADDFDNPLGDEFWLGDGKEYCGVSFDH